MLLNLNDPLSIVRWWMIYPERHGPQLQAFAKLDPARADAIRLASGMIQADPELAGLLARAQAARGAGAPAAEGDATANEYAAMAMGE